MATIRVPEQIWSRIHKHLFSTAGEHFAFMLARWTYSNGVPTFLVQEAICIADDQVKFNYDGWELSLDGITNTVNQAVRSGLALIEAHNHGGTRPRFSLTDRAGLKEFPAYILNSLPNRPYAATVWGDSTIYGECFMPDGPMGQIMSVTVIGEKFQQLVSLEDDDEEISSHFDRQLPWFSPDGQRQLARLKVGIVGAGGTGSQIIQNLVHLGVRDFVLIDNDVGDDTNMNRLVTATDADIGTQKVVLGRRLIRSVAPDASVNAIATKLQSGEALESLKGVDLLFGCVDNDGARLILNEIALAYGIPYLDVGVGIEMNEGRVAAAGGRVAIVLPNGPCLNCMKEIDPHEARFFLSSPEEQQDHIARGYVQGMDIRAPSVAFLNAMIVAAAVSEFAILLSGMRHVNFYTELDLMGTGRATPSQWMTPRRVERDPACVQCASAWIGDKTAIERYSTDFD